MARGRVAEVLKDKDGLTPKQRGFVRDFLKSGNATEAYRNNYDTNSELCAGAGGGENLQKRKVAMVIQREYRREGIDENYVLSGLHTYAEKGKVDHRWASPGVTALDRIGRFVGMFKDSDAGGLQINVNVLNLAAPDEIRHRAETLAARLSVSGNDPLKVSPTDPVRLTPPAKKSSIDGS